MTMQDVTSESGSSDRSAPAVHPPTPGASDEDPGRDAGRVESSRVESGEGIPPTGLPRGELRRRRREWTIAGGVAAVLVVVFLFEGVVISRSQSLPIGSDAVFFALVHLNVLGIGLLAWLLSRNVVKLVIDRRRGIVGSKLNTKFVVSFVFTAALSTTGLFILSGFLVTHTIDTWFRMEPAGRLTGSLDIADTYYAEREARSSGFAHFLAHEIERREWLSGASWDALRDFVERKRAEYGVHSIEVVRALDHRILASAADPDAGMVALEPPDPALIRAAARGQPESERRSALSGEQLHSFAGVRGPSGAVEAVLIVESVIPPRVASRVRAVERALASFEQLEPSTGPFRGSMITLLAMLTFVSLLFSSWMGFRLAKQVTDPIQRLALATKELAGGNLGVRVEQRGEDELGMLVAAFNGMADDLQASRGDLERRRALMEIVLGGVGAGVLSLDAEGRVTTVNPSARRLLGIAPGEWVGRKYPEMLEGDAVELIDDTSRRLARSPHDLVRRQVTISAAGEQRVLNCTVSQLRDGEGEPSGVVVLIDDVTQIVRGQRTAAWRDVARRIAHEIKNPLTPIQLSAQRLRRKLEPTLDAPESRHVLEQCTDAITGQVEVMKGLLQEFSNFAQLPATDPTPTDLSALAADVVALYRGKQSIRFRTDLAPDLPKLGVDREQMKRVILNLIDNAMGALDARDGDGDDATYGEVPREIVVSTRLDHSVGTVHLEIADTGVGIRPEDRAKLFQPGFSTKADGTGIGLSIVSRIVSDHSGTIRVRPNRPCGTRFVIELPARI